ncbi:unnamed protein product [Lactuca virosa]|uniref:Uncharacterized protein n=1 Tax=Lactuca virosa TaxID=75947 RepID=A0AAU9MQR2_9ASTR|nr:unnamed protein product [Lactuca virosa]
MDGTCAILTSCHLAAQGLPLLPGEIAVSCKPIGGLIPAVSLLSEVGFLLPPNRMSVHVARGHGGDGGGEPPRQPHTIPRACESSKPKRDYKRIVYLTLHNYFDIDSFRDTPHWNGIVQGIDADFKASYRCMEVLMVLNPMPKSDIRKKKKPEGKTTLMDGKKSHFKEGKGWCHLRRNSKSG